MLRSVLVGMMVLGLIGCEGAVGPVGPPGPEGPEGPAGPIGPAGGANKLFYTVALDAFGDGIIELPAEAGSNRNQPPSLSCYIGQVGSQVWLSVAGSSGSSTAPFCGLVFDEGRFSAVLARGPAGWLAAFVVVY